MSKKHQWNLVSTTQIHNIGDIVHAYTPYDKLMTCKVIAVNMEKGYYYHAIAPLSLIERLWCKIIRCKIKTAFPK